MSMSMPRSVPAADADTHTHTHTHTHTTERVFVAPGRESADSEAPHMNDSGCSGGVQEVCLHVPCVAVYSVHVCVCMWPSVCIGKHLKGASPITVGEWEEC